VGTFVLRWSDEGVWGPDDRRAGYVHRLATRPDIAGHSLGAKLLDRAAKSVAERGGRWLRLDCDQDNAQLRRYYEALGFEHVRDVDGLPRQTRSGSRSASLYQRPISISGAFGVGSELST
jgi:ribosomal protein S18 acetylase RimI-like enzyme